MPATPRAARRRWPTTAVITAAVALAVLVGAILVGGATGQRPHLSDAAVGGSQPPTGDPAIDAVLARLDAPLDRPVHAAYRIVRRLGNVTTTAEVDDGPSTTGGSSVQRTVRIGQVRFETGAQGSTTCRTSTSCAPGLDQSAISDTGVSVDFYRAGAAARLRRDATSKIGPGVASTATVAGQPATCVEIPVGTGQAIYCVADSGVVVRIVEGDVLVDATQVTA